MEEGGDVVKKKFFIIAIIFMLLAGVYNVYTDSYKDLSFDGNTIDQLTEQPEDVDDETIEEPEVELPTKTNIKLLAVGDIMFHSPQFQAARTKENTYDFTSIFEHVESYIHEADLALGNFETVTAGKDKGFSGYPRFNSPKEVILAIKEAGFDILSTANNHSLDQGKKGIISTIDAIEEYNLKNIGTYKEPGRPILIEDVQGIKIGLLCYTYGVNGLESLISSDELEFMINRIDEDLIQQDIVQAKDDGAEIVVVFIHWGYEYHKKVSTQQVDLSKKMVEWGANIILGSHPHVIQKAEIIEFNGRENYVIYSMGNFLSNQRLETMGNSYTEDGVMVQIELEKNLLDDQVIIKDINYIPTWVYRYSENNKFSYEIIPLDDIDNLQIQLSDSILTRIRKSYKDTMDTLNGSESLE